MGSDPGTGRTRPTDAEVDRLLDDYRAVNNGEAEGDLGDIAEKIRARQAKLISEEGHTGIGDVVDE